MTPEIVTRARAGDGAALAQLAALSWPAAFATCLSTLRRPQDAEDCAQDAVLLALRKLPSLREPATYPGWLVILARRLALKRCYARARRDQFARQAAFPCRTDPAPGPAERLAARDREALVRRTLDRLSPLDRRSLEDYYLGGLSVLECAAAWGVPESTAKQRLFMARRRARPALAKCV